MRFSLTNSIGKKVYTIIGMAVTAIILVVGVGFVSSIVLDCMVAIARGERDHTTHFFQSTAFFQQYVRDHDKKTLAEYEENIAKAIDMSLAFGGIYDHLEKNSWDEVAAMLDDVFPTFTHFQGYVTAILVETLSFERKVTILTEIALKAHASGREYKSLTEKYLKKENEEERQGLLKKMDAISQKMVTDAHRFTMSVGDLSAWALSVVRWLIGGLFAAVFLILVVIGAKIAQSIRRPIKAVVDFGEVIARGDLSRRLDAVSKDETALLIRTMNEICDKMGDNLARSARASRVLAKGASEQASSIQETSSSLEEMASMARRSADNAAEADNLMKNVTRVVNESNDSMEQLTDSMTGISGASEETRKIIKSIDEIAFQTNLLALNAAVEAARAGEAGAGFAVVAEEVRNLAIRSAEAAGSTAELIEDTVKKTHEGATLVHKTAGGFREVTAGASKIGELLSEIADGSREQARGVERVNMEVSEMDKVVQQNATSADELASGVNVFKTRAGSETGRSLATGRDMGLI